MLADPFAIALFRRYSKEAFIEENIAFVDAYHEFKRKKTPDLMDAKELWLTT